jgi:hypothetical protein
LHFSFLGPQPTVVQSHPNGTEVVSVIPGATPIVYGVSTPQMQPVATVPQSTALPNNNNTNNNNLQ